MDQSLNLDRMYTEKVGEATGALLINDFENEMDALFFVNWCLSKAYNEQGILSWWNRPRIPLERRTPIQAWPEDPDKVLGLASYLVGLGMSS